MGFQLDGGIGLGSVVLGLMFWSGLIEFGFKTCGFGFIGGRLQVLDWALELWV